MISNYIKSPKLLSECHLLAEPDIEKYIGYLETRRYSDKTITSYISSVIHYFSWRRKINKNASTKITDKLIHSFLSRHLKACKCPSSFYRGRASCAASLRLWRRVIEVDYPSTETEENRLLNQYEEYLKSVVGLASTSRQARCRYSHELITWLKKHLSKNVSELSLQDLATYVYQRSSNLAPGSVTAMVSALGYFVSYLSSNKHCSISLPVYIPRPKPVYTIPAYEELSDKELSAVLQSFDRNTAMGKRDYGMACCLVELGLRTCDTARLSLDGIDWRHRAITLEPGKNHRQLRLPISDQLFDALADYLQNGRPSTTERTLFVYHRAPVGQGVSASTVRGAMRRGYARANISPNRRQLHRFRHTMATRLLKSGASIKSIADVLGHQSIEASNRYTHVDINGLKRIGLPWPQGGES
jgi:integrase/recombinase XerD